MAWMSWTVPTALFFITIGLILVGMTVWQFVSPSSERRGWLPLETTRGDRLFIGLLSSAYLHLAYLLITDAALWIATIICAIWVAILLRWG